MNPEQLLTHANFMSALAYTLVYDEHRAADITQDTWVAALESRTDTIKNTQAWLATVTRNFARMMSRGENRRRKREKAAAVPEGIPSTQEIVAEEEIRRKVVDAVLGLDAPYRSIILLLYYRDLSYQEAAERLGVPLETMRSRLKKGIALLRERLDASIGGDRNQWIAALAPIAALKTASSAAGTAAGASSVLAGGMALLSQLKLVIAATVVIGAAIFGFWKLAWVEPEQSPGILPILENGSTPDDSLVANETDTGSEREAIEPDQPAAATVATTDQASDERKTAQARVGGRFLDESGAPVPDVRINRYTLNGPLVARTGFDGRFEALQEGKIRRDDLLKSPIVIPLFASKQGFTNYYQLVHAKPDEAFHIGDIVLKPGGDLSGRVIDQEGRPVAGAEININNSDLGVYSAEHLKRFGGSHWTKASSTTDENGLFRCTGVEVGWGRVWAKAEGTAHAYTDPVEIHPGRDTADIELILEPMSLEGSISGIVLSPEGEPVPHARIHFSYRGLFNGSGGWEFSCEEDGRFWFIPRKDTAHNIEAIDWGRPCTPAFLKAVEPGTHDLVIRLAPMKRFNLEFRTKGNRRLKGVELYLHNPDRNFVEERATFSKEDLEQDGKVEMQVPAEFFQLNIRAHGFEVVKTGLFDPHSLPDPLVVELVPVAGVKGRVLVQGRPTAGAQVSIHEEAKRNGKYKENGFLCRSKGDSLAYDVSDEQGRFDLALQQSGVFYLRAEMDGFAPAEIGPIGIDHTRGMDDLEITLTKGGAIEGRVLVPPGESPAGIIIGLSRADGFGITFRIGSDRSYRFESLTPGAWNLKQCEQEIGVKGRGTSFRGGFFSRAPEMPWVCVVEEGKTTLYDLDLTEGSKFLLRGRLLLDGKPPKAWNAVIHSDEGRQFGGAVGIKPPTAVDFEGGFLLQAEIAGPHLLGFTGSPGQGPDLRIVDRVILQAGETPWNLDIALGQVTIKNVPEIRVPYAQIIYKWQGPGNIESYTLITPESSGETLTATVPAGKGWIMQVSPGFTALGEMKEEVFKEVDLSEGGSVTVEF